MIPYLILLFLPIAFTYVAFYKRNKRLAIAIGKDREITKRNLMIPAFFVIFFLLLSLRHISVGVDLVQYKRHFDSITYLEFEQVLVRRGDLLYNLLNWLVSRVTTDYRIFITVAAAITLIPIAFFTRKIEIMAF